MAETKKLAEVDVTEYTDSINLICEQSNTIRRVSVADVKSEILSDIQAEFFTFHYVSINIRSFLILLSYTF